jgi:ring-1,2-phenylacetyl-CoA epoxidase subunit PaaC
MQEAKELILKMADDALVAGHRNSEWTGLGPILEEDIAFSSMAQDKIGHALALYTVLHEEFGMAEPDQLAFHRPEKEFRCCKLVELPIGEYDFSLARHFLFDHAEAIRYELLTSSSYKPLAQLANKIKGELKYHVLHANTWIIKLARSSEENRARMQQAINEAMPFAMGMFEEGEAESAMVNAEVFPGEKQLQEFWEERMRSQLEKANLEFPDVTPSEMHFGGRKGHHTAFLHPLLEEMTQVFKLEENVEW